MDLFVEFTNVEDLSRGHHQWQVNEPLPEAWRVAVLPTETHSGGVIPLGFARKKDAEIAMNELVKAGLTDGPKISARLRSEGRESLFRIMCENLQW